MRGREVDDEPDASGLATLAEAARTAEVLESIRTYAQRQRQRKRQRDMSGGEKKRKRREDVPDKPANETGRCLASLQTPNGGEEPAVGKCRHVPVMVIRMHLEACISRWGACSLRCRGAVARVLHGLKSACLALVQHGSRPAMAAAWMDVTSAGHKPAMFERILPKAPWLRAPRR